MAQNIQKIIAETFLEMADGIESGRYGKRPKIALTGMGSEHGEENSMQAALMAAGEGIDVYYIGSLEAEGVTTIKVKDDEEGHAKMEELLESGEVDAAVTMHYPFPIGVSTVGRVVTPARGKEVFIANTTGTSSTDRIEGMVKNAICGIIAAKACGVKEPSVGILNVDGARQTESILKELAGGGYPINFAESARADGGCVMRGNDLLQGTPDIMVTDSLTGNVLVKTISAFQTGGSYEAMGYGYGPGIGEGYDRLVMIISRASGAPVIAGAIRYAAQLVRGNIFEVAAREYAAAEKAGLSKVLNARRESAKKAASGTSDSAEEVKAPPSEIVTEAIAGIEVMDLEDGVQALWKQGIYAESGMGCTGPIIRVSEANLEKSCEILKAEGFIG
ncbi:MAG: glycine reductase [Mogibacterium sp.]|nr:glycine reductase [Mogibacterium sp.]